MLGLARRFRAIYRRVAVVPMLLISARLHRYRSNRSAAREKLLRATTLAPSCFKAHLRLGALYLEDHDFYKARREFLLARDLDPGKFRRLYPLITGQSGDININLFYFPGLTDQDPEKAPEDFLREFIGEPLEQPSEETIRWGDFSSYREFRKFQEMGPFQQEEMTQVDWESVLERFEQDTD